VLVPLDGSAFALAAVDELLELRGGRELDFVLLAVVPPAVDAPRPLLADALAYASAPEEDTAVDDGAAVSAAQEQHLNGVADRLRAQRMQVSQVRVVVDPHPSVAINRAVRESSADFVAMTTRGLSGLKRVVIGSVAERVVRDASVPVLLVTPR
jgi:nucleotide-binding universal stress UspA family protein